MNLPKGTYHVQQGQFGLLRYGRNKCHELIPMFVEWFNCRDSFQGQWNGRHNGSFFYVCNKKNIEDFINVAEKSLGLWIRTKVYTTRIKGILCIWPSPFWEKQPIRMSLFTILLRAAHRYSHGMDWREILFDYPYAHETRDAIAYFFAGHTVYTAKDVGGWHQAFAYEHPPIDKMLRRPWMSQMYRKFKRLFVSCPMPRN